MKTSIKLILALATLSLFACNKLTTEFDAADITATIAKGKWEVTYYYDGTQEVSDAFASYVFDFQEDGTMEALDCCSAIEGGWTSVASTDGSDIIFSMDFASGTGLFDDLNVEWAVIEKSNTMIKLLDEAGTEVHYLHFEKI